MFVVYYLRGDSMKNSILHIDIDAFYASVEELDNPSLVGKPVVVSGLNDKSIVTTANYEARKYKIHSAMPLFMAKKLCPHLIVAPMRRNRYIEKSDEVFKILSKYSDIIEKVSIDECYMDISENKNQPVDIVFSIKKKVKNETGLTVSVGLSYNKFLAKMASDWNKPDGMMIISKSEIPQLLSKIDIGKIHGLGNKSQEKLRNLGINKIEELLELDREFLFELFGKMGYEVYDRIRGIDNRAVTPNRERKSLGIERTFSDTNNVKELISYLDRYSFELAEDLKNRNLGFKTITLKIKTDNFKVSTYSKTYSRAISEYEDIFKNVKDIFEYNYKNQKLRLIGISASNLIGLDKIQLSFIK